MAQINSHLPHTAAEGCFPRFPFKKDQLSLLPHCDPKMLWLKEQNERERENDMTDSMQQISNRAESPDHCLPVLS